MSELRRALSALPLIFLICFLAPQNFGFGLKLNVSLINAEREAEGNAECKGFGERAYNESSSCKAVERIRYVYEGMKLSEIRREFERGLLRDKLLVGALGSLVYSILCFSYICLRRQMNKSEYDDKQPVY